MTFSKVAFKIVLNDLLMPFSRLKPENVSCFGQNRPVRRSLILDQNLEKYQRPQERSCGHGFYSKNAEAFIVKSVFDNFR